MYLGKKQTKEKREIMKNRIIASLLMISLVLSLTACGNKTESAPEQQISETVEGTDDFEKEIDETTDTLEAIGDIEIEENLFSVELTIPAEYVGEMTQEELNQTAEEKGYKSVTLNEDGSATYVMTKAQHEEMMAETVAEFKAALDEMVGSEDYPNITDISVNSDFTEFTITTSSTELDMNESLSVIVFYMYGAMYHIFNGTTADNIHVDFVNADSGEVINSADSSDME